MPQFKIGCQNVDKEGREENNMTTNEKDRLIQEFDSRNATKAKAANTRLKSAHQRAATGRSLTTLAKNAIAAALSGVVLSVFIVFI